MTGLTSFKAELVRVAWQEHETLGALRRGDRALEERILFYCREVDISATPDVKAHYSAVFISWCMCTAGASKTEFRPTAGHCVYARQALRNAEQEEGPFRARRVESYAPKVGDVIHVNRDDGKVDYDQARHGSYHAESGIVVDIRPGEALIVMGNQEPAGNVGTEKLALADSGLLVQRADNPFICVIEVLK
jgi:hypothetical protein